MGERKTTFAKAYGIIKKKGDIEDMLRNIMKTWGTSWERDGDPLRT
jgi:hypothetical protein